MDDTCTIYRTVDIIGKRWTLLILLELYKGKKRYSELKKKLLNITPKMLAMRLKELEKEGIVQNKIDSSTIPVKSEYSLTDSGKDFIKIIHQMKKWGLSWKPRNKICGITNCKQCDL